MMIFLFYVLICLIREKRQIWFRSKFETILKHENITEELRDELKKIFHQQTHISITTKIHEDESENQIAFVDEVKKYLKRLSVPESYYLSFGKDDIAYSKEIKKVRGLFQAEKFIMKLIIDQKDYRVKAKEVLTLFEKYMDIVIDAKRISKISSIVEVWEILEEFMLA